MYVCIGSEQKLLLNVSLDKNEINPKKTAQLFCALQSKSCIYTVYIIHYRYANILSRDTCHPSHGGKKAISDIFINVTLLIKLRGVVYGVVDESESVP